VETEEAAVEGMVAAPERETVFTPEPAPSSPVTVTVITVFLCAGLAGLKEMLQPGGSASKAQSAEVGVRV